jgi:hypothetical protein
LIDLAEKGGNGLLKDYRNSMQCTILFEVTINGDKLTPLVEFKGMHFGRIARNLSVMLASMQYDCLSQPTRGL